MQTPLHIIHLIEANRAAQALSLDLRGQNLLQVPPEVLSLAHLQELWLDNNAIQTLPDGLRRLPKLKFIDLRRNPLHDVGGVPRLVLDFGTYQRLEVAPEQVAGLWLRWDGDERIEDLLALPNLIFLDLSQQRLREVPEEIFRLGQLEVLDLSDNELEELPSAIAGLSNLTALNLAANGLSTLPASVVALSNLSLLNLTANDLKVLPEAITELPNLCSLILTANELSVLPQLLVELPKLSLLDVSYNSLHPLPEVIAKLSTLTSLNLSGNELSVLPEITLELSNLTFLNLGNNSLSALPGMIIANLSNLSSFDLSHNALHTLPKAMGNLRNLSILNLEHNHLSAFPAVIYKLRNLSILNLANNRLNKITNNFPPLSNLSSLNLGDNALTVIPKAIDKFNNLMSLDLSGNNLSVLSLEITKLPKLSSLNLSRNRLCMLPEDKIEIYTLANLLGVKLDKEPYKYMHKINMLGFNSESDSESKKLIGYKSLTAEQIERLHDYISYKVSRLIAGIHSLRSLDLSYNSLTKISRSIFNMPNIDYLNLSHNNLSEILDEKHEIYFDLLDKKSKYYDYYLSPYAHVGNRDFYNILANLNHTRNHDDSLTGEKWRCVLFLPNSSRNNLSLFPEEISWLPSLSSLNLSHNNLYTLPNALERLSNLSSLNLAHNNLQLLPDVVAKLSNIFLLDLSHNSLQILPEDISKLYRLYSLDLSYNNLQSLPEETLELPNLSFFNLSHNNLQNLPENIDRLSNLSSFDLSHNNLRMLPKAIITLYNLRDLQLDKENSFEQPPLEVFDLDWEARANITKIRAYFRQLAEQDLDYIYEAKFLIIGEGGAGKTTLARRIQDAAAPMPQETESTEGIDVHRWEFPLADGSRHFRLNIWDFGGQEIYHATHQFFLTKRSLYVLVVDTRRNDADFYWWLNIVELLSDNSPVFLVKNRKDNRAVKLDEDALRGRFANLKESFDCNLAECSGLAEIVDFIRFQAPKLPIVGQALPKSWIKVRAALEADPRHHLSLDEYLKICAEHGFKRRDDKLQLSQYLHDLGVCLHFQDNDLLRKTVILKPQWGTEAVYHVLDDAKVQNNLGHFDRADLARIWQHDCYADMHGELLELMKRFQLCYALPADGEYIAPQLLAKTRPKDFTWNSADNLVLRFTYPFMPKGIVNRLAVAIHPMIENQRRQVWQHGVVVSNGHARALVTENIDGRELEIRVAGRHPRDLMSVVVHELEKIHDAFNRLRRAQWIPCQCAAFKDDPYFFPFEELRDFAANGEPIQCRKRACRDKMRDAGAMLDGIFSPATKPGGKPARDSGLLRRLNAMLPAEFEQLVFEYGVPPEYLSIGPQTQRAIEVLRYAESRDELAHLQQLLAATAENDTEALARLAELFSPLPPATQNAARQQLQTLAEALRNADHRRVAEATGFLNGLAWSLENGAEVRGILEQVRKPPA